MTIDTFWKISDAVFKDLGTLIILGSVVMLWKAYK